MEGEFTDMNRIRCKTCLTRQVHTACHASWQKTNKIVLSCPCGGNYGPYRGPRSSLTTKAQVYAMIEGLLHIKWTFVQYPYKKGLQVGVMYSIISYLISPYVAAFIFGVPMMCLVFLCIFLFCMKSETGKPMLKSGFRYIKMFLDENETESNLEQLMVRINSFETVTNLPEFLAVLSELAQIIHPDIRVNRRETPETDTLEGRPIVRPTYDIGRIERALINLPERHNDDEHNILRERVNAEIVSASQ
jgi:hypothetical protein